MDKKKQRTPESQNKQIPMIQLEGQSYTIEEAGILAINEQDRGNLHAAEAIYDTIIASVPGHADAYNSRGKVLHAMKRYEESLASYDHAIILKPDYAEAYFNQGALYHAVKQYADAIRSYDKAAALKPDYAEAYNNLGSALKEINRIDEALTSYDIAITLKPDYAEAWFNRGCHLQQMKRPDEALVNFNKAIALQPGYAEAYNSRGTILQQMNQIDEAAANYVKAIALKNDYTHAWYHLGTIMISKGNIMEAEKIFLKTLELEPGFSSSFFSLTKIRKYQDAGHEHVKTIQRLLANPATTLSDKEDLYFSLGKIYDDCGLYDEAFEAYRHGNRIINDSIVFSRDSLTALTDNIIRVFSKEFLTRKWDASPPAESPIFIVGMPRSGTTLMSSILSNHPSIGAAGELPTIGQFTTRLLELTHGAAAYPQAVTSITPEYASRLRDDYSKRLRRDTGADIAYVIDKCPHNFRHLGFIAMLFPKARIIHCVRDPLDTALSIYFQLFSSAYDYSFDLQHIGHFYKEYVRIMEHWRQVLPLPIMEVRYEDMVMDTEKVARRALDFLGLAWDERCLAPHTNPHAVETASQWQVRQPIYTESIGRWRHYEKHLAQLKEILQLPGED